MESESKDKLNKINYMLLEDFKNKYINQLFQKGISKIDKNHFKKDNKNIRNLSQISYRLLNFILYSHLFFANLCVEQEIFDKCLPKGMNWIETIRECWNQLKNELSKIGIKYDEIFMNYCFKDLFEKLNDSEPLDNYEKLVKFEDDTLEPLIKEIIEKTKEEIKKYEDIINKCNNDKDKNNSINLLKEIYTPQNYKKDDYPFYEHFYYCSYLDEFNIRELLGHKEEKKYPILHKYLLYQERQFQDNADNKEKRDNYSLDNLYSFNTALNLFHEIYSLQITREKAQNTCLKDEDNYTQNQENKKIIDNFIKYFNTLLLKIEYDEKNEEKKEEKKDEKKGDKKAKKKDKKKENKKSKKGEDKKDEKNEKKFYNKIIIQ